LHDRKRKPRYRSKYFIRRLKSKAKLFPTMYSRVFMLDKLKEFETGKKRHLRRNSIEER